MEQSIDDGLGTTMTPTSIGPITPDPLSSDRGIHVGSGGPREAPVGSVEPASIPGTLSPISAARQPTASSTRENLSSSSSPLAERTTHSSDKCAPSPSSPGGKLLLLVSHAKGAARSSSRSSSRSPASSRGYQPEPSSSSSITGASISWNVNSPNPVAGYVRRKRPVRGARRQPSHEDSVSLSLSLQGPPSSPPPDLVSHLSQLADELGHKLSSATKSSFPFIDRSVRSGSEASGAARSLASSLSTHVRSLRALFSRTCLSLRDPEVLEASGEASAAAARRAVAALAASSPAKRARALFAERCRPFCWKVAFWFGLLLVCVGLFAMLVGFRAARADLHPHDSDVDASAVQFNFSLEMLKLVGLVVLVVGAATLVVALLVPAALWSRWRVDSENEILNPRAHDPSISTNRPASFAPSATPAGSLLHEGRTPAAHTLHIAESSGQRFVDGTSPQVLLHTASLQLSAAATAESALLASCPVGRAPLAVISCSNSSWTSGSSNLSNGAQNIRIQASVHTDLHE